MTASPSARFREALEAFQQGDLDRARAAAEEGAVADKSPNWSHLLGLIHCRLGDPTAGVEHLRSAAQTEPGNAAFQVMLARALVDSGRPEEVLAMPEPPRSIAPAVVAQWQVRGEAAEAAGNREMAVEAWRNVAAATPRDWRAWSAFGNALASQNNWTGAAEALAEAHELNPAELAVRSNFIAALVQAGRQREAQLDFDEAESAFRRAYKLEPADASVVYHLGIALERTNRLDQLKSLLEEAAAAGIPADKTNYLRAALARRDGRLEEARDLLAEADPDIEPVRFHALRAKIFDALGDHRLAFDAATEMNRAATERSVGGGDREEWERQTRAYRADLHELAEMITPEWAAGVPRLGDPATQRLSFLLGFPRSGTTLLDTFLMGHPEVAVLEEKQLVARAADVVGGSRGLSDSSVGLLRKARAAYHDALAGLVGTGFSGLVVDKFPLDMAAAPVIEAVFPGAPMIFAQRHPCDVVLSGFMQPIGVVNFSSIEAAADYYDAMMSIWTAARETLDLNVHTVVYEELVVDPEAVLRPLLDFLGLAWDDRLLDHRTTAKARGTIVTPSYDQVTEPISTRPVGRWKRYEKEMADALPILLPWAERLGYRD